MTYVMRGGLGRGLPMLYVIRGALEKGFPMSYVTCRALYGRFPCHMSHVGLCMGVPMSYVTYGALDGGFPCHMSLMLIIYYTLTIQEEHVRHEVQIINVLKNKKNTNDIV